MIDYSKNIEARISTHASKVEKMGKLKKFLKQEEIIKLYSKVCSQLLALGGLNSMLLEIMGNKYKGNKSVSDFAKLVINTVSAGDDSDKDYYTKIVNDVFEKIDKNEMRGSDEAEKNIIKTKAYILTDLVNKWSTKNTSFCKVYSEHSKKSGKEITRPASSFIIRPKTVSVKSKISEFSDKPREIPYDMSAIQNIFDQENPKNKPIEIPYDMAAIQNIFDDIPSAPTTLRRFESMSTIGSSARPSTSSQVSGGKKKKTKAVSKPKSKKQPVKSSKIKSTKKAKK